MSRLGLGQVNRVPSGGTGGGSAIGYSSVANGTNPLDVTFPITSEQIAMVQYGSSDWTNAPEPAVSGDVIDSCFWDDLNAGGDTKFSGGGWVTGDGSITLSLDAMTGGDGGYINVMVMTLGQADCEGGA